MTKLKFPSQELDSINLYISIQSLETYLEIVKLGIVQAKEINEKKLKNLSLLVNSEEDLHELRTEEEVFKLEYVNYYKGESKSSQLSNISCYSIIPICYMLFETNLAEFAKIAKEHFSLDIKYSDLSGAKIEKIKTYLDKFAGLKVANYQQWSILKDLETIRNCIIHNDGIVNELFRDHKKIRLLPDKYQGKFFISSPIHSDYEVAVIKFALCETFIKNIHCFFDKLVEELGFHKEFYFGAKASKQYLDERIKAKIEYDEAVKKAKEIYNKRLGIVGA